jgi:uroporphyrin-III C-methyltransferase/precorrin-2 dehydrogenase/sirohydrochlorin ferrochelatase
MQNYPIFVDLQNQPCLVVGGGEVAARKVRLQLSAGAKITIISPRLGKTIQQEMSGRIEHIQREFNDSDIEGYRLITAATDNASVNRRVSELAQKRNIPVNVVDQPHLCSFITPSIVDRGTVTIAISTGGGAPVLARTLRSEIEAFIPASYGKLASAMQQKREEAKKVLPDEDMRRRFWDKLLNSDVSQMFLSGRDKQGLEALESALESAEEFIQKDEGEVWLVGAGPGDPDLLTFRALRLMQQCDVVLHDALVSDEILNLCRRDADRIYVGKRRANHAVPQEGINQLLITLAKKGKKVVRLKGGDPFIFGRGGEEIEELVDAGIPFQIVPGITSASGCATYAGIPLTHRDYSQSVTFVAGHLKGGYADLNWSHLAAPNQTLVIYMGLIGLPTICEKLISHGVSEKMPIAIVEKGTRPDQRVLVGTLSTMPDIIQSEEVQAPTLIIIGGVVELRDRLAWR